MEEWLKSFFFFFLIETAFPGCCTLLSLPLASTAFPAAHAALLAPTLGAFCRAPEGAGAGQRCSELVQMPSTSRNKSLGLHAAVPGSLPTPWLFSQGLVGFPPARLIHGEGRHRWKTAACCCYLWWHLRCSRCKARPGWFHLTSTQG